MTGIAEAVPVIELYIFLHQNHHSDGEIYDFPSFLHRNGRFGGIAPLANPNSGVLQI